VADDKPAHDRALELFVYAPVGVALYVRDMLPTMVQIFVSRGKREVQSHLPGSTPPAPPPAPPPATPPVSAPSPADVRRRVEEGIGLARVVTGSGFGMAKHVGKGVAKGVAGTGVGFARDLAGTAAQGFGSPRSTGDARASETSADPRSWVADLPKTPSPAESPTTSGATASGATATSGATAASAPPPPETGAASADDDPDGGAGAGAPTVDALAIPDYDELSASQVVERLEGLDHGSLDAIRRYESAHRGRNTILGKIAQLT
jgi:hypothetical protein